MSANSFSVTETNGTISYTVTDGTSPALKVSLAVSDPANWLAIGTQVWAKTNLNVGTMITGATNQTNNGTIEKYCYNNSVSNCNTYGGLYKWDEMMQYNTNDGAQGICPTGSHVPTDNDLKILEISLGMSQAQADAVGWRGTDQGTKLQIGGLSNLDIPIAGFHDPYGSFYSLNSTGYIWSSTQSSGAYAWYRWLQSLTPTVNRSDGSGGDGKLNSFSVRCKGN